MFDGVKLFSKEYITRGLARQYVEVKDTCDYSWKVVIIDYLQIPLYLLISFFCKLPIVCHFMENVVRTWERGRVGFFIRACYYKTKLGFMGRNVFIDQNCSIFGVRNVFVGDGTHIDRNVTIICASGKLEIGKHVHIANDVTINAKPWVIIGDYTAVAAGAKIYGSTNKATAKSLSPMSPLSMQNVVEVGIYIGRNALVGINTIVLPGARIGDYACVGGNSYVDKEIPERTIAIGSPAKVIRERKIHED